MNNSKKSVKTFVDFKNANYKEKVDYITSMLKDELPASDSKNVERDLEWSFLVDKSRILKQTSTNKPSRKKKFLTRQQRKNLGMLKLPKSGWNYEDLQPMRDLWLEYMQKNLNIVKAPKCTDSNFKSFNVSVGKSEFVGAELTVIKSKVPSVIGMTGTVVLETKETFQIVTPKSELKILLKEPSVFTFKGNKLKFTVFGKHIIMKPNDRSTKKIRQQKLAQL